MKIKKSIKFSWNIYQNYIKYYYIKGENIMLNITDIRVRLVKKENLKLKGVASITIDGCFVVHEIKIIEANEGLFVSMPSRKTPEGEFKDTAHPIDTDTRKALEKQVLEAYEKALKEDVETVAE